ncbi:MAG: hypothetical protein M1337_05065 [Actinobacteria bacterium]|nr:hypothetical protein [Actinomycetota bacterium]
MERHSGPRIGGRDLLKYGAAAGVLLLLSGWNTGCAKTAAPSTTVLATVTTVAPTTTTAASTTTAVSSTTTTAASTTTTTSAPATSTEYRNAEYGFTFALPVGWKGYSIVNQQWEGFPTDASDASSSSAPIHGPEIIIRHPKWTYKNPRQDIPIMVFSEAEWNLVEQAKLGVGAAPVPPSELGRNATYVFALPARYNYVFPTGWEEVAKILEGKPLKAF